MATPETPVQIISQPGIKRDGTMFEGEGYVDGLWCRFQRGLPRKMSGYRSVNKYLTGLVRTLHQYTLDLTTYIHAGSANKIERLTLDSALNSSVISDRTPGALTADPNNMWQFDVGVLSGSGLQILAQVAPNLDCICNSTGGELYFGSAFATTALAPVTAVPANFNVTGGIVSIAPYMVAFGNDGYVAWSTPGDPTDFTGSGAGNTNITGQKIVRGLPLRGGPGSSPSALLWSADSLLRMQYTGDTTAAFAFDTISAQTSIMSAQSVIEFDGIYYWVGSDRFLMFNGVVREIPNGMNRDFFFDNMNYNYRQKVFAFAVPRFGEIWWCFPKGDSEEPNHAVILNVRENTWYDTPLPNGGRGAATSPSVFRSPMLTGVDPGAGSEYRLWVHERGVDEIDGLSVQPIRSYFETADISFLTSPQPSSSAMQVLVIEPDFVQSGPMTVQVQGRRNARAPEQDGTPMEFPDTATTVEEEVVFLKEQRRQLRFHFESNVTGGYYEMGHTIAHIRQGDGTTL